MTPSGRQGAPFWVLSAGGPIPASSHPLSSTRVSAHHGLLIVIIKTGGATAAHTASDTSAAKATQLVHHGSSDMVDSGQGITGGRCLSVLIGYIRVFQ